MTDNNKIYSREIVEKTIEGIKKYPQFMHFLIGPRQVGKTTAAVQLEKNWDGPVIHAAADLPVPPTANWLNAQWELACSKIEPGKKSLLVVDEIQKVRGWSEALKEIWDTRNRTSKPVSIMALGSSSLLVQKGLSESLSGRFMLYRYAHWNFREMKALLGWELEQWLFHGGYPGAGILIDDFGVWRNYIMDSLVETVLARDVLQMQTVAKPTLLRHLFGLASTFPAQILSYTKMLGQLQDAGNTTTLSHYLKLLESAFFISGLELFRQGQRVKRGSSPKLIIWNNALVSAYHGRPFPDARQDGSYWGRLVENAVGAHLLNGLSGLPIELFYWRDGNLEVDFVLKNGSRVVAVEVKSSRSRPAKGLEAFMKHYPKAVPVIVGTGGIDLETFFLTPPQNLPGVS